ncbi:translation elongation factor Ts [Variovorax sp. J22R24]|uniref:translation elongation factor Ts n=1 Tax=Variovorax gracilis TaxID=3053502 RepID=UPI0025759936|nr:translation elongation factor Ts [Variovorax sp. J22R24]MDM0109848.1 translation elongation factor Ts [Variovorax sp. J22R24]
MSNSEKHSVSIRASDDSAEVCLFDDRFNIVAQGLGSIAAQVDSGVYKVQQSLGDIKESSLLEISNAVQAVLPPISFASPISLPNTRSYRPFQATNRGGVSDDAPLVICIRDPAWQPGRDNSALKANLVAEAERLTLLDDHFAPIGDPELTFFEDAGSLCITHRRYSGNCFLAQSIDPPGLNGRSSRLTCLPLSNLPGSLQTKISWAVQTSRDAAKVPLDLDRVAIQYKRIGYSEDDAVLRRLEALRKLLSRPMPELTNAWVEESISAARHDPMLGIFTAHALLQSKLERAGYYATDLYGTLAEALRVDHPEVIAIHAAVYRHVGVDSNLRRPQFAPATRRGWLRLMETPAFSARATYLPETYSVLRTVTWFLFSTSSELIQRPRRRSSDLGAVLARAMGVASEYSQLSPTLALKFDDLWARSLGEAEARLSGDVEGRAAQLISRMLHDDSIAALLDAVRSSPHVNLTELLHEPVDVTLLMSIEGIRFARLTEEDLHAVTLDLIRRFDMPVDAVVGSALRILEAAQAWVDRMVVSSDASEDDQAPVGLDGGPFSVGSEGAIGVFVENTVGAIVELGCETDFVAGLESIRSLAVSAAMLVAKHNPADISTLSSLPLEQDGFGPTLEHVRKGTVQRIGEGISFRRFKRFAGGGELVHYMHGTGLGVVVEFEGDASAAKDVAMHIAAMKPIALTKEDIPPELTRAQLQIAREKVEEEDKTSKAAGAARQSRSAEVRIDAAMEAYFQQVALYSQPFLKNDRQTVRQMLEASKTSIRSFTAYEAGVRLERKIDHFAATLRSLISTAKAR